MEATLLRQWVAYLNRKGQEVGSLWQPFIELERQHFLLRAFLVDQLVNTTFQIGNADVRLSLRTVGGLRARVGRRMQHAPVPLRRERLHEPVHRTVGV